MTETELEYHFCFNCNDRKQCYTKPKDCTRIQEEIGLQEMTNEEWFCSLSTEEKAKVLACEFIVACDDYAYSNNKETWNEKYWVEWLKQPHTIKEQQDN